MRTWLRTWVENCENLVCMREKNFSSQAWLLELGDTEYQVCICSVANGLWS